MNTKWVKNISQMRCVRLMLRIAMVDRAKSRTGLLEAW